MITFLMLLLSSSTLRCRYNADGTKDTHKANKMIVNTDHERDAQTS
jgi:hypothetical protein